MAVNVTPAASRLVRRLPAGLALLLLLVSCATAPVENKPGCVVAISRAGEIVSQRATGMANLEHSIPNTPETIFEAGSVSKQFTAAAIVLLARDGLLKLDDSVRKYVPELPAFADAITIRHLLTHTSGLRDWGTVVEIGGWPRGMRAHTHGHVLEVLARQRELNFPPGTQYSYSNSGYNLAAIIAERASGKSLPDLTRERIFLPLGMTSSSWRDDYARVVPRRATAYVREGNGPYRADMHAENIYGNCCLLTTARDLLTFTNRFDLTMLEEEGTLTTGEKIGYALGVMVRPYRGLREVAHSGATGGYRAYLTRFPERKIAAVALCNDGNANAPRVTLDAIEYLLPASGEKVALSEAKGRMRGLQAPNGLFLDPENHRLIRIHGNLLGFTTPGTALTPLSETSFRIGQGPAEIHVENDAVRLVVPGRLSKLYEPVEPATTFRAADYLGEYTSDEAQVTYVISGTDETLTLRIPPNDPQPLIPTYADGFRLGRGTLVRFTRDASGRVDGLEVKASFDMSSGTARVERMRFVRR